MSILVFCRGFYKFKIKVYHAIPYAILFRKLIIYLYLIIFISCRCIYKFFQHWLQKYNCNWPSILFGHLSKSFFPWGVEYALCIPVLGFSGFSKEATKGGGPSNETVENEVSCHSRYGTIKTRPCSNVVSAKPVMVTSLHE